MAGAEGVLSRVSVGEGAFAGGLFAAGTKGGALVDTNFLVDPDALLAGAS